MSVDTRRRARVRVTGTVQGVGFRPFVYRLARELGLGGFVLNDSSGVLVEIEGGDAAVTAFFCRLESETPPLAVVEGVLTDECDPTGAERFEIRSSARDEHADAPVTPDTATCGQCLGELFDPADRRFRYPFINCTNCGPRFTIVRGIPYDRLYTTMAGFEMCGQCRREYEDPADRRFHAQPNACRECGPSVRLVGGAVGSPARDPVEAAAIALREGAILAVKGIGGYHLACRADDERVVGALRSRKHREDKPFALMVATIEDAVVLVALGEHERDLLTAPSRPIVLTARRDDAPVAPAVAPGARELGVMLPYSPLHHLLLHDVGAPLVMTSGNVSDEPIAFRDEDALGRLAPIADLFLTHDRAIETRTDDSVVRSARGRVAFVRRSRGYIPGSLRLPGGTARPLLACGAELKNTFCLAKGERAWVSHHIGDLENYETLRSFTDGIEHFKRLFSVDPEVVAYDLHPEYLSTKYALERDDVDRIGIQHHHAHLAACLAEHGVEGPALGAIFDGTGYGADGSVWGGELLCGDLTAFRRVGTLLPVRMPGGERAIRQPWRMACAWIDACGSVLNPQLPPPALANQVSAPAWQQVCRLVRSGVASPPTSSMGRLFDAVAALCGICATVNYEGQAAIELERACRSEAGGAYPLEVAARDGLLVLDPRETIRAVAVDVRNAVPVGVVASRFHAAVARATVEACTRAAGAQEIDLVVLSGGVFQNQRLRSLVAAGLDAAGLRVLVASRLPLNDGGISYGQAAIAARRMMP